MFIMVLSFPRGMPMNVKVFVSSTRGLVLINLLLDVTRGGP